MSISIYLHLFLLEILEVKLVVSTLILRNITTLKLLALLLLHVRVPLLASLFKKFLLLHPTFPSLIFLFSSEFGLFTLFCLLLALRTINLFELFVVAYLKRVSLKFGSTL